MKTRTLRDAISLALFAMSGAAGAATAQAAAPQAAATDQAAAAGIPAPAAASTSDPAAATSPEPAPAAISPTPAAATELETIEVTGTRIKGGAVPSPVMAIDAARIREEDFGDLGEVIRSVPQNFSGGQNPGC